MMFHFLAVLLPLAMPAQFYTSHGGNDSDPGDLMLHQPYGQTQNITRDDDDDARERARDEPRYSAAEPEFHRQSYPPSDGDSDADIQRQIDMSNAMGRR